MAAAQAGETPSDEMIQKAQRAGEHMNKLLAAPGADSTESSSTPMPSTSTPAPNADGISEAPSGPTDADVAAVDTMMDELGLPADEKAAMDAMMAAAQAGETPSDEMIQKAQRAGEHIGNKAMDEVGLPADEQAALVKMWHLVEAGETPSPELSEKAMHAAAHLQELEAAASAAPASPSTAPDVLVGEAEAEEATEANDDGPDERPQFRSDSAPATDDDSHPNSLLVGIIGAAVGVIVGVGAVGTAIYVRSRRAVETVIAYEAPATAQAQAAAPAVPATLVTEQRDASYLEVGSIV